MGKLWEASGGALKDLSHKLEHATVKAIGKLDTAKLTITVRKGAPKGGKDSAQNIVNQAKLQNQLIAEQIVKGHSFEKHVITQGEFPGWIRTREQLKNHIENVLNAPETVYAKSKSGKSLFYHEPTNTIVIRNPKAPDGGTVFQPESKVEYFLKEIDR